MDVALYLCTHSSKIHTLLQNIYEQTSVDLIHYFSKPGTLCPHGGLERIFPSSGTPVCPPPPAPSAACSESGWAPLLTSALLMGSVVSQRANSHLTSRPLSARLALVQPSSTTYAYLTMDHLRQRLSAKSRLPAQKIKSPAGRPCSFA
jgi:hypothetical protein